MAETQLLVQEAMTACRLEIPLLEEDFFQLYLVKYFITKVHNVSFKGKRHCLWQQHQYFGKLTWTALVKEL